MNELRKKFSNGRHHIANAFSFPMSPRNHFRRLLVLLLIGFLAVVAFHVYYFYRIQSHAMFQAGEATAIVAPTVNEAKLTKVLSHYEDKAAIRTQAGQLVPVVLDPTK